MTTNNAVNIGDAGIVLYNGTGDFTSSGILLSVANGGTGSNGFTEYAVLVGGTTASNPIESITDIGTAGQVLTSNGASDYPSFQSYGLGYGLRWVSGPANPADSTTYYMVINNGAIFTNSTDPAVAGIYYSIPKAGTLDSVKCVITVAGTLGSSQNCTLFIRVNNTTDTNLTTTLTLDTASQVLTFSSIGLSLNAGDFVAIGFTGAAWSPNPTSVAFSGTAMVI